MGTVTCPILIVGDCDPALAVDSALAKRIFEVVTTPGSEKVVLHGNLLETLENLSGSSVTIRMSGVAGGFNVEDTGKPGQQAFTILAKNDVFVSGGWSVLNKYAAQFQSDAGFKKLMRVASQTQSVTADQVPLLRPTNSVVRLVPDMAGWTIRGIQADEVRLTQTEMSKVNYVNASAFPVQISDSDGAVAAEEVIRTGVGSFQFQPNDSFTAWYDRDSPPGWRILS